MKVLSSDVWPSPECPVQSGGRKREWNLGLGLPGAPQPSPGLSPTHGGQQQPTVLTPLSPLPSPGERESSKVQYN